MTLSTFQPKARVSGDKLNLQQYAGRPLLVRPMEFVPDFSSRDYPEPKPVVFADVVDLISGQIFINVLWGAGAVVDNLKDKVGTNEVLPLRSAMRASTKRSGTSYIALEALEGPELDAAVGWYNQHWALVDQTRMQRQAQAAAAAPAQPPVQQFQQSPAQQFQQPPVQQFQQSPAQQFQQPPAQQFQQPGANPQFGVPAQQPPVNGGGFGQYAPPAAPQGQPQGFGQPQGGVFTDVPPPAGAPGQFAPPQAHDPAAAQAALAHLNQQVQG